jgi:hypothetical protein
MVDFAMFLKKIMKLQKFVQKKHESQGIWRGRFLNLNFKIRTNLTPRVRHNLCPAHKDYA